MQTHVTSVCEHIGILHADEHGSLVAKHVNLGKILDKNMIEE